MSRWFRTYDDIINDPKILILPDAMRWIWIAMLCIASKHDGVLPPTEIIALSLRVTPAKAALYLNKLVAAELIDHHDGIYSPHNWATRQYKSDTSTERVKRHRETKRNVSETPPETETEKQKVDDGGDAPARATIVSKEALRVADAMAVACGHDPDPQKHPLGWHGAARWVQRCLDAGWPAEVMIETTKLVARRKRGEPIDYFKYLEKPLARAVAELAQPLTPVGVSDVQANAQPSLRIFQPINGGGGFAAIRAGIRRNGTND